MKNKNIESPIYYGNLYKLVLTEKVTVNPETQKINFPFRAMFLNTKNRKKKIVFLHNQNELDYWLNKKA